MTESGPDGLLAGRTPVDIPLAPQAAGLVFGDRLPMAAAYVRLLADTGTSHGLIGPREVPRLWDRHVLNCAVVAELIPPGVTVFDIGSGAGLPGLALAVARPDLTIHLIEPLARRVRWLEAAVAELGLDGVTIHCRRAEDLGGDARADVVTARAVASLSVLARWSMPLLPPGGRLLALKGAKAEDELSEARSTLRALGATESSVRVCGAGVLEVPTRVIEVVAGTTVRKSGEHRRRRPTGKGGRHQAT